MTSYTRDGSYGPTQTKTATVRFEQRLRGVLSRINAAIREAVINQDIFQLKDRAETLDVSPPDKEPFRFRTDDGRIQQFLQWLRTQLENELLQVVTDGENPYIRRVFTTGIRAATKQLSDEIDFDTVDLSEIVEQDRFDQGLQTLFTRTYENLQTISRDILTETREELTEGFAEGNNPRKIARKLTDRVDSVGKHRATLLARTEVSNAHTQGFLNRVEQAQDEFNADVGLRHVGRLTANDARVCPFCRNIEDVVFTTDEFATAGVQWGTQTMRVGIPSHPQCRCTPMTEMGVEGGLGPLSERLPNQIAGKPVTVL